MEDIKCDLNEIVSIPFRECSDGTDHPCLWRAQFSACLRESTHSQGKAELAPANFRERAKCAQNSEIIDSENKCLAFRGKL